MATSWVENLRGAGGKHGLCEEKVCTLRMWPEVKAKVWGVASENFFVAVNYRFICSIGKVGI